MKSVIVSMVYGYVGMVIDDQGSLVMVTITSEHTRQEGLTEYPTYYGEQTALVIEAAKSLCHESLIKEGAPPNLAKLFRIISHTIAITEVS